MDEFQTPADLRAWLLANSIDLAQWNRNGCKGVAHLWAELDRGESRLQRVPLLRLVEVVQVIVRREDQVLIEARQDFASGASRERDHPPSEKMRPGEDYHEAALRCLQEELGVVPGAVEIRPATHRREIEEGVSPSYPGLCTRYALNRVEACVEGLPVGDFSTTEHADHSADPVARHYWTWAAWPK